MKCLWQLHTELIDATFIVRGCWWCDDGDDQNVPNIITRGQNWQWEKHPSKLTMPHIHSLLIKKCTYNVAGGSIQFSAVKFKYVACLVDLKDFWFHSMKLDMFRKSEMYKKNNKMLDNNKKKTYTHLCICFCYNTKR